MAFPGSLINNDIDSFKAANSLLKNPSSGRAGNSFGEIFESETKEVIKKVKEKTNEITDTKDSNKKKKISNNPSEELLNFNNVIQSTDRTHQNELKNTYSLLDKYREDKKSFDEEYNSPRQQTLNNAHNIAGQPLFQPVYDQPRRKMSKSDLLQKWEKLAPTITEDITKRSIRLDIPMLSDVQALVLRLNPDRSISASMLGSKAMAKLIKENKDKLDKNLRHHQLSLKEFNTYSSELTFNSESGTKKRKKQAKPQKGAIDLI